LVDDDRQQCRAAGQQEREVRAGGQRPRIRDPWIIIALCY
jgi:hypothetical protein